MSSKIVAPLPPARRHRLRVQGVFLVAALILGMAGWVFYGRGQTGKPPQQASIESVELVETALKQQIQRDPLDRKAQLNYLEFLLDRKRHLDALELCQNAAQFLPNDPAIRSALADAFEATGQINEAIRVLANSSPAETALRLQLARLLVRDGQVDKAARVATSVGNPSREQAITSALILVDARRPLDAARILYPFVKSGVTGDVLNTYGFALLQSGNYKEAAAVLQKISSQSPSIPTLHYYTGCALRLSNRRQLLKAATDELRLAVTQVENDALFQYELGRCMFDQGNWEVARNVFQKADTLGKDHSEIHRELSYAYKKTGQVIPSAIAFAKYLQAVDDPKAAVRILQPLAKEYPSNVELGLSLSVALHAAGQYPEATTAVERLRELKPKEAKVIWSEYHLHNELKRYDRALDALDELGHLLGEDPALIKERAVTLQRLSRYQDAERLLTQLCDLTPEDSVSHYNLGLSLSLWSPAPDARERAEEELRRAIELRPNYSEALYALGQLLQRTGRPSEAVVCLRRALDFTPAHPDALRLLGRTYSQLGDEVRSKNAFELFRRVKARSDELDRLKLPVRQLRDIYRSRMALARFHLNTGNLIAATKELEIVAYHFPEDVKAHQLLAPLYGHARRFQRQSEELSWLKTHGLTTRTGASL